MANKALITDIIFNTDIASFNAAVNSVNQLDKRVTGFLRGVQKISTVFAVGGIAGGITSWASGAMNKYAALEEQVASFTHSMNQMGVSNKGVIDDMVKFSESMEKSSKFEQEQVLNVQRLLSSFGIMGDKLKSTTMAAMDLSSGLGIDLNAAALLLGKAFAGETGTLSRYGIVLQEGLSKSEKFAEVIKQVNERFGGAAQAELNTYSGRVDQLKKSYDDVLKTIGKELLPYAEGIINYFKDLTILAQDLFPYVSKGVSAIYGVVSNLFTLLSSGIITIYDLLKAVGTQVGVITGMVVSVFEKFNSGDIRGAFNDLKNGIFDVAHNAKKSIKDVVSDAEDSSALLKKVWEKPAPVSEGIAPSSSPVVSKTGQETPKIASVKNSLADNLALIKAQLKQSLSAITENYDEQEALIQAAADKQVSLIKAAESKKTINSAKAKTQILQIEGDAAEKIKELEKEKAKAAQESEQERERIANALLSFGNKLNSDEGKLIQAYFSKAEIASAEAAISMAKDSEEATRISDNQFEKLTKKIEADSKKIGSGFKIALAKIEVQGTDFSNFFGGIFDEISSGFGSAVSDMIVEGKSFSESLKNIGKNLLSEIISQITAMVVRWAIGQAAIKTGVIAGAGIQTATGAAASAAAIAQNKLVATDSITAAAATGAAWAEAASMMSIVGIPLAPAAGAAAYATIISNLGLLAFKLGGYTGDAAADTVTGIVHGGEYVLPATVTSAYNLRGKNVNEAVSAISGGNSQVINSPVNITVSGNINSDLDVKKVCRAIATAVKNNVKEAVYMANVTTKSGTKKTGYAT